MSPARIAQAALLAGVAAALLLASAPGFAFDRANPPRLHRGGAALGADGAAVRRAASAFPDAEPGYHNGASLACSDCHIAHASQSHAYDTPTGGPLQPVPFGGPAAPMLLRAADPLDLCLSCHDDQTFAPDVMGADANGLQQRSAGHFGPPLVENRMGHDLGRGLPAAGSYDFCSRCHFGAADQKQVTCVDCHNPHGNGRARNLQWASWPEGTPDLGLFTNPAATGMSKYERENVSFGTLNSEELREASNICIDCHHVFSGGYYVDPDGDGIHSRHPTSESERGSTNNIAQGAARQSSAPDHWNGGSGSGFGSTPRVRPMTMNATNYASARVVDANSNGVFCLSCHSAHGSDRPFGLVFPLAGGSVATGCDQCHLVANVPSGPGPFQEAKP